MASRAGRGAQVILDPASQAVANGSYSPGNLDANILRQKTLMAAGTWPDAGTADGSNGSGTAALDYSVGIGGGAGAGTATNDNAAAGNIGEFISSTIAVGSAVSLTSTTAANVTSISLTAGDWDVFGNIITNPAGGTTTTVLTAGISATSATQPAAPGYSQYAGSVAAGVALALPTPTVRVSIASTTTYYMVATATFATSTLGAYGILGARRRR